MKTKNQLIDRTGRWLSLLLLLLLVACQEHAPPVEPSATPTFPLLTLAPETHRDLRATFAEHGYDWSTLEEGVPPIVIESLPPDMDRIPRIQEKKKLFFLSLLPMILLVNDEIQQRREELTAIFEAYDAAEELTTRQLLFLADLAEEYRVDENPLSDPSARAMLLKRVDIIPPSMVLAQAATESGFGTSRIARTGNNLFGEYGYITRTGSTGTTRQSYELRTFPTLIDSVRSYMRNLNTNEAYQSLRDRRASLRRIGENPKGLDLVNGLRLYSTREEDYIQDIRTMIRKNRLSLLSGTSLRSPEPPQDKPLPPPGAGLRSAPQLASRLSSPDPS